MPTIRSRCKRDSLAWRIARRTYEIKTRILDNAKYRSPIVKGCRFIAYSLKPWGVISGGTDCDGMRYSSASLLWTRKAAEQVAEESFYHAEGPSFADVVTGRIARHWEASHIPDTRDRYAEAMGY